MPVGSEDSMQAEINHDTVTREMDLQACDCEECQQGRRADSAGTRRDLRSEAMVVCELCQKESEPMSDVWFCDACKKNLCKSCGNVELCPLESCSKQLCSKCARKSKCKGCKRGQPLEGNTTRTGAATGGASSGGVTSSRTMNSRPEDLAMSLLGAARAASSEAAEAARVVQALEETMELEAEKKRLEERIAELEAEKKRQQEQLKDSLEEKKRQQEQLKDLRRKKDAQNGHEACESGAARRLTQGRGEGGQIGGSASKQRKEKEEERAMNDRLRTQSGVPTNRHAGGQDKTVKEGSARVDEDPHLSPSAKSVAVGTKKDREAVDWGTGSGADTSKKGKGKDPA